MPTGGCREIGLAPLSPSLLAPPHKLEGGSSPSFTLELWERLRDIGLLPLGISFHLSFSSSFYLLVPWFLLLPCLEKKRCDVFGKSKSGGASLVLLWGCGNTRTDMWVQGEGDTDTSQTT